MENCYTSKMVKPKHFILFSHGFGVDKTGRGLFTDIVSAIPDIKYRMFDFNQYDQDGNMTITPINEQVEMLRQQLDQVPGGIPLDIIAHSQGCIVTALAKPQEVRRIILLAPPTSMDKDRMLAWFSQREGADINPSGTTTIPRRDGSTSIINAEYWQSIQDLDVMEAYKTLARENDVVIVRAVGDEVVGETDFSDIKESINLVEFPADHNFTGQARQALIDELQNLL